jgi:DNA-directed RNA polymerase I and III subunit RPAC1
MAINANKVNFESLIDSGSKTIPNRKISFRVKEIDICVLNSVRRVIQSDIPNLAFEFKNVPDAEDQAHPENRSIQIITNTHPLNNEIIAHRLGLLPLNFEPNEIIDWTPKDRNKYIFVIKKKNIGDEILDVTTEDIIIQDENGKKYSEEFIRKIFPSNYITKEFILITKLKPNLINKKDGEELYIEMRITKNIAKKHAGYGYVSDCTPSNVTNPQEANKALDKIIKKAEKDTEGRGDKFTQKESDNIKINFENLDMARYYHKNKYGDPNHFVMNIESERRSDPRYLFFKALLILDDKIQILIKSILNNTISFNYEGQTTLGDDDSHIYIIDIPNEGHTLGYLIQSLMINLHKREKKGKLINYVGYRCPHPLENHVVIRVGTPTEITPKKTLELFVDALEDIQEHLRLISNNWLKFSKLSREYAQDIPTE